MTEENLEKKTEDELDAKAKQFVHMVEEREYTEAQKFYKNMSEDEQNYIAGHKEYRWSVKSLRISCM